MHYTRTCIFLRMRNFHQTALRNEALPFCVRVCLLPLAHGHVFGWPEFTFWVTGKVFQEHMDVRWPDFGWPEMDFGSPDLGAYEGPVTGFKVAGEMDLGSPDLSAHEDSVANF
ncbi:hypothetical protein KP509_22G039900 [Ceratopteris richardii]|uniref:Uncharacterized protein n=1 Tax=Ceratopteris richardii TaxID=49495 RepID=A0A8T2S463_CERRI|nr:hypothetical protein KP509_22G039900 [Ceratopteris richardii]